MPYNPNNPTQQIFGPIAYPQIQPGTTQSVSHSFSERLLTAEFDDALVDQAVWKNPRYEGCKFVSQKINQFTPSNTVGIGEATIGSPAEGGSFIVGDYTDWPGDITFQDLPVIRNVSTALYIANTVIGGTEDPQFTTLKNHSYVNISKILLVNLQDNSVLIINKETEPYEEFHRFLTNDFPTGNKTITRLIDESIGNNLQNTHRVKMNKGFLLKSFKFENAGEVSGSVAEVLAAGHDNVLTDNNSMYLYKTGSVYDDFYEGGQASSVDAAPLGNQLRFRYGIVELIPKSHPNQPRFHANKVGPSFNSSSIFENKFTSQYYSGSFGLISGSNVGTTYADILSNLSLGSASRFLGKDTLSFLGTNNANSSLAEQEKTEVHITFFEGTKDFTRGISESVSKFDERSMGTFEVDQSRVTPDIGDTCNNFLPRNHELIFKGNDDSRFLPTITTFQDDILSVHPVSSSDGSCFAVNTTGGGFNLPKGLSSDFIEDAEVYVQGGALGQIGYRGAVSGSVSSYSNTQSTSMTADNYYSGSFSYELSFLDKNHTLILNLDKEAELFNGIGEKGMLLIPQDIHPQVSNNIEYYLNQAGIINNTTNNLQSFNLS